MPTVLRAVPDPLLGQPRRLIESGAAARRSQKGEPVIRQRQAPLQRVPNLESPQAPLCAIRVQVPSRAFEDCERSFVAGREAVGEGRDGGSARERYRYRPR
jgi:hypothetical protein